MTLHALGGLAVLNLLFLLTGAAVLWLTRGWRTWVEFARLIGLAYLVGVAVCGSLWTLLLVAGFPLSLWLVLLTPLVLTLGAVLGSRRLRRARPTVGPVVAGKHVLVSAVGIAAAGVFLEALFRASRLAGLYNWDAWAFWVPKGEAIYFLGGLDHQFFTSLPGAPYPPLVPALDGAAFHLMGSPDAVTLHLQFWFLGAGFIWALAGLLSERVPAPILWPFVLLVLVAPFTGARFATPEADFLLDFFFVVSAVLVSYWLGDRERWQLVVATVLLCGLVLTKREGLLLSAVLVAAALLASARDWRGAWPWLGISAVVVVAVSVPWRIWYLAHGIHGEGPSGGFVPFSDPGRAWPSLRLAIHVLFDSGFWNVIVPVAVGALVVAALARVGSLVVFFASLIVLLTLAGGWITWSIPELPITSELGGNPIVRFMASAVLLAAAAAPMLLAEAWSAARRADDERGVA